MATSKSFQISLVPTSPVSLPYSSHLLTVKLNHDNYLLWKAQLPYLRHHNLFRYIDGLIPTPQLFDDSLTKQQALFTTWKQQDQVLMSILISSLSENLIAHVLEATSSHEVWEILEELFSAKTQARTMQVHFQLATLKKGSETIAKYYQCAKLLR